MGRKEEKCFCLEQKLKEEKNGYILESINIVWIFCQDKATYHSLYSLADIWIAQEQM